MASAKKNETATTAPVKDFDFAAHMPAGYDAKDLRAIGGLTPIYAPEEAFEGEFPPVVGLMDRMEILPEVQMGRETYIPRMIRVVCKSPTKGMTGKKGNREAIDIAVGEDILVPLTGNLGNNKTLLAALQDPNNVYLAVFHVKGAVEIGQPSPMWDWDVRLHPKTQKREGRFALPQNATRVEALPGTTSDGTAYDKDGVVKEKLVSAPAAAAS